jgi:ABC-type Mn2+/Zn2+ transport system ATPase subunit
MEVKIINCNNIDSGLIQIANKKLNIKFGVNGTGKSTIARAIGYNIESPERLEELIPFKHRDGEIEVIPEVHISEDIQTVLIFDESYLDQFLFKEDELISNSYQILIETPEFKKYTTEIEKLLSEIEKVFDENDQLDKVIADFENLSKSFATTQSGLSKSSALYKGLKGGNKVRHIPDSLKGYSRLIKDRSCVSWLDWQSKGEQFLDISDDCPYCTSSTLENKETIKSVSNFYNKTVIRNFNVIVQALESLGEYFSETANTTLKEITEKQAGLEVSEMNYIVVVKQQIDDFIIKLRALKNISPLSFNMDETAEEKLKSLKINVDLFDRLGSVKTIEIISFLNSSLDTVLEKVGILEGEINRQKILVRKLIEKHKRSINYFLVNAGYKYVVEIENSQSSGYKLLLKHVESDNAISGGRQFLSFGEKNAFSLVLFMYEALQKKPDLIVLDDPISSFDKSKKYAIMHMLFRGKSEDCLLNKTVLMLTHDLDPVIDTVKVLREFSSISRSHFLSAKDGQLTETEIKRIDILSFAQICKKLLDSNIDDIIKLIYLRRHYEILDDLGSEYEVLSNLLHKRKISECTDRRKEIGADGLSPMDFSIGVEKIKHSIPSFDYEGLLYSLNDFFLLKNLYLNAANSYCKLNVFRLIYDDKLEVVSSVLRKFINETFHIENELICQLDPNVYDLVPNFIIEDCDRYIDELYLEPDN